MTELRERVDALAAHAEFDVEPAQLADCMDAAPDAVVLAVLAEAAALANSVERLRVVAAGVTARRSSRDRGHSGLAATHGHRSPSELIQSMTGVTRVEAQRQLRQGEALLEAGGAAPAPVTDGVGEGLGPADRGEPSVRCWHDPLRNALLDGTLTAAQHDAIFRGLGQPPAELGDHTDADAVAEVWSIAATQLRDEASGFTPDELLTRARQVRDALDSAGAEARFAKRYADRSFRMWVDRDGQHQARIAFDDEMAAWVRAMHDAALRPRRGGPRFVDPDDARQAEELVADPRTNDQLAYDLVMEVWRAGALAEKESVFGARQPGVRMVVVKDVTGATGPTAPRDAFGRMLATGHLEDGGDAIPGTVLDRVLCETGHQVVIVDACGNPLDVGREQRLFTPKQRIALAVRDGGCLWPGCRVPASYCEAHHCDHWHEDAGRTDCDRGILLCRFHHMHLHNQAWRITRDRGGPFLLHPPPGHGDPIPLLSRSPVRWAWDPPRPPDRVGWRAA